MTHGDPGTAGQTPATTTLRLYVANGSVEYQIVVLATDEKDARRLIEERGEEEVEHHLAEELRFVLIEPVTPTTRLDRKWRTALPYMNEEHEDIAGDKTVDELLAEPPVIALRDNRTMGMFPLERIEPEPARPRQQRRP